MKTSFLASILRSLRKWLPALTLLAPLATEAASTQAVRVNDFLDSIGVCSAVSRRGEKLANTIAAAQYLGLRWVRSGYESGIPVADLVELHRATGVRFSYGLMSGGTNITRLLEGGRELAKAGALLAFEGNNEPNNWGITYAGERGGRTNSWRAVANLQKDLYRAIKSDPLLKDYPVWSPSESGAQTDNVGLQFLTVPASAGALMPAGTQYADYANCHNYLTHPGWPGLHENQTWIAADPTRACKVDGLFGNYGSTWKHHFSGYSEAELLNLPRVTTETGVTVDEASGVTEHVQACFYLRVYLDQFKRGWKNTAIYLLRDRTDESGNQAFGFYRPDYTPRLAAAYLHNLTAILAGSDSRSTPGDFDYSIPNKPATVHDLLLQKSAGTFELIVWAEQLKGSTDLNVIFSRTPSDLQLFDPTIGSSPVQTRSATTAVDLTLSDHPMVIQLNFR